jgi:thiamine phosphate synthase YjbQ (UPF0047 family)
MLLYRIGIDKIQPHPIKDPAPNISGEIAVNESMSNGFIMIITKHTTLVVIINNNSFIKLSSLYITLTPFKPIETSFLQRTKL